MQSHISYFIITLVPFIIETSCFEPTKYITKLVYFETEVPWMVASLTCFNMGGKLVENPTEPLRHILKEKYSTKTFWMGLIRVKTNEIPSFQCAVPDLIRTTAKSSVCSLHNNERIRRYVDCESKNNFLCEIQTGKNCKYEYYRDKYVFLFGINDKKEEVSSRKHCQELCTNFASSNAECWLFVYEQSGVCQFHASQTPIGNIKLSPSQGNTVAKKVCFEHENIANNGRIIYESECTGNNSPTSRNDTKCNKDQRFVCDQTVLCNSTCPTCFVRNTTCPACPVSNTTCPACPVRNTTFPACPVRNTTCPICHVCGAENNETAANQTCPTLNNHRSDCANHTNETLIYNCTDFAIHCPQNQSTNLSCHQNKGEGNFTSSKSLNTSGVENSNLTRRSCPTVQTCPPCNDTESTAATPTSVPCPVIESNLTRGQKVILVQKIVQSLTINVRNLSSSKRKFVSADDPRPSAKRVGMLGVALLSVVLALLVILDLPRLIEGIRCVRGVCRSK